MILVFIVDLVHTFSHLESNSKKGKHYSRTSKRVKYYNPLDVDGIGSQYLTLKLYRLSSP
jgi:hypothetical protein